MWACLKVRIVDVLKKVFRTKNETDNGQAGFTASAASKATSIQDSTVSRSSIPMLILTRQGSTHSPVIRIDSQFPTGVILVVSDVFRVENILDEYIPASQYPRPDRDLENGILDPISEEL